MAGAPPAARLGAGTRALGLGAHGDALLHVPVVLPADEPAALVVLLHGAGSTPASVLTPLVERGTPVPALVVAPQSCERTWDAVMGRLGPDVALLDAALAHVFATAAVDPARVVLAGFSDGASYALTLGLANGDLVSRVVAFSPGFVAPAEPVGRPELLLTHGVHDAVLPIDRCSRRLLPALLRAGYDVHLEEFDGGHAVPPEVAGRALAWAVAPRAAAPGAAQRAQPQPPAAS